MKARQPLCAIATILALLVGSAPSQDPVLRVITMPRDGETIFDRSLSVVRRFDADLVREWREARERARAQQATILVFEVTATGGELAAWQSFADDFQDLRNQGVRVVAFVPEVATGVAALVALEADVVVLGAGGRIGDADPTRMDGTSGSDPSAVRRDVLRRARATARRNAWPELFVDAMIDPDVEITEVRRPGRPPEFLNRPSLEELGDPVRDQRTQELVVSRGQTLTLKAEDAARFGFPFKSAGSRDDLLRALKIPDHELTSDEIIELKKKDLGSAEWFHMDWSILLLAAGIFFLILELKTPGLGINGVLGVACLCGYFLLNANQGGIDALFSIGLLLVGFLLLLIEIVFLPGFGVPGILGIALILFSIYAASIDFGGTTLRERLIPDSPADYVRLKMWLLHFSGSLVLAAIGAMLIAPKLHKLPLLNHAFLAPPVQSLTAAAKSALRPSVPTSSGFIDLEVGAIGSAETDLRPAGIARLRDHRVDVVTDGEFVARGSRIVVTAIEGHRVVVRSEGRA